MKKVTFKKGNGGVVAYSDENESDFYPFLSTDVMRLVEFFCENVAEVRLDDLLTIRRQAIEEATDRLMKKEK